MVPPERAQLPRGVPHLGAAAASMSSVPESTEPMEVEDNRSAGGKDTFRKVERTKKIREIFSTWDNDSDKGSRTDDDDFDDDEFRDTAERIDDRRKKTQIRREARDIMFKKSEDEAVVHAKHEVPQWIELLVDQTTQSWGNAIRAKHHPCCGLSWSSH